MSSRRAVVSDSSVIIDLERGFLSAAAFGLRLAFYVPDLLYRRELQPYGGARLLDMGLEVLDLDGDGVIQAEGYRRKAPALSLPDAFALALAYRTGSTLLTGDSRLRRVAIEEQVACHGVLWLMDRMLDEQTATPQQLYDGLVRIQDHPRCRLPKHEINKRLRNFERAGKSSYPETDI